ncbi:MAG: ADP-glyceromanno-heptose 6-epimerase [Verrucomicrobiota bacterium]
MAQKIIPSLPHRASQLKHDLSKKKILVTGGAGFIGSALVWALNQKGLTNIVISDFLGSDEKWKNLVPLRFDDYLEADSLLERVRSGNDYLKSFHTVFHLGANSSTTETNARHLIQNNFEFTKLLSYATLGQGSRFVYASSAATYGNGESGMSDQADDLSIFRPLNMYGYSKHMFDLYAKNNGFLEEVVGLKYFNVYGPNEQHKGDMRSLVIKAYEQLEADGCIRLFRSHRPDYKDGEQMRDFLYVKDAVKMTIHLAETSKAGGLFNLGSGEANTWIRLAKAIFKAAGKEENIEFIDMPEALRDKYQYYTCANVDKLRDSGYEEAITVLEDAVGDYVREYLIPSKRLGD